VYRTVCGKEADVKSYVDLLKMQMESGAADGGPDLELCERVRASGLSLEGYVTGCNSHLLKNGLSKPAVCAVYADINS
jgi:hypothetical protein